MNFSLQEYPPSALLSPFVECYWKGAFNLNAEGAVSFQMVPNACLELIIHLDDLRCNFPGTEDWVQTPDYMIIGLITQPHEIRFPSTVPVFTIRFKPEALYHLFRFNGSEIIETYEDMTLLLGNDIRDFCHQIREESQVERMIQRAENYLLKKLEKRKGEPGYVNQAAELIRNSQHINIRDISDHVCVSQRQLERKFREVVGVSPKHYLRLTRMNRVMRVLEQNRSLSLSSVAYYCGYFDQAHFIKDFKRITGLNPTFFHKERQKFIVLPGQVYIDEPLYGT
ncbi:AraC-like DNA-binding protein [Catalinimonas alkaloidigena]|uniref:helix-turn-helix transcriptional regulator n=1 Tax=Catalinimonas alkaloidigena TaxID=1075417 RepID=UPI002405EF93|nr:helix-turn-helix transcriptional regulator [Catalinimonas alkaloidigena]MDF9800028.1 AraC-like DNA-binding protein [Catalinimonas alkaloidigena]